MAKSSGRVGNKHFYNKVHIISWSIRQNKRQKKISESVTTIFPLLIISSTVFLRGTIKQVLPRCKHPRILPNIWSTSSDELIEQLWKLTSRISSFMGTHENTNSHQNEHLFSILSICNRASWTWLPASSNWFSFQGFSFWIYVR